MIKLIVGNKGSGKTKTLIHMVNEAAQTSNGNVVCIEKGLKLTYDLDMKVQMCIRDSYIDAINSHFCYSPIIVFSFGMKKPPA